MGINANYNLPNSMNLYSSNNKEMTSTATTERKKIYRISQAENNYVQSLIDSPENTKNGVILWKKIIPAVNQWLELMHISTKRKPSSYKKLSKLFHSSSATPLVQEEQKDGSSCLIREDSQKVDRIFKSRKMENGLRACASSLIESQSDVENSAIASANYSNIKKYLEKPDPRVLDFSPFFNFPIVRKY
ncbi:MAG: hypothetical protein H0X29_08860 [Parachlamydiaceae bacterium]|nr:hypothetical protein [Parachlamydiaceae bacterium]